ncbi:MAG TPA: TRAP transporter large permease [Syntrophorhabdaceae bacterium]|nr:TRAP transporter large permease [Syntrophorhabdaceae bacterium]HNT67582.1 TRAP transporter large permease [Syntrophorhabdaceae bacterium]
MEIIIIFAILLVILATGLPVFISLASLAVGILLLTGQSLSTLPSTMYAAMDNFVLLAVPLFMLMAHIMTKGGVGDDLFDFVHVWLKHLPGGIAMTAVVTCSIFAAICGSSAATAVTIGIAAIPAMLRYKYEKPFVLGLVAAGGTLGILIPPSGPMIIYGAITDTSVGKLFIAGIVPGILISLFFLFYCWFYASRTPGLEGDIPSSWLERWKAFKRAALSLIMPPVIIGGIYLGIFTPTEAAGIGALMAFVICFLIYRRLGIKDIPAIMKDTVKTTAMIFMIIGAAVFFGQVLTINQIPQKIVNFAVQMELGKWTFLVLVNLLLLFLGCFLEVVSIILIVVPIFFPVIEKLGIDPVWFGIIFTINMELALITPPVGMNLYVIMGISDGSLKEIVKGVWPFILMLVAGLILVMLVPDLSLWLTRFVG